MSESSMPLPFQGSNNWVLAGSRTESGRPILANDPHLEISLPPIWYEIHVSCPGLNAVGVSLPGVPLVIIGHNESIAWGITNSAVDVQDLFIERLNPARDMYWDNNEWRPLFTKEERIKIRGEKE
ncbi:MAG: penicillin acylase family protein, partial [Candidatus Aminicenantes bacterium]|nr:penicillin acylase family protein [Candidatus Aminicenantes bacterium]